MSLTGFFLAEALLVVYDQADLDAQRRRVGHPADFAFLDVEDGFADTVTYIL